MTVTDRDPTTPPPPADLDALERALASATPGPWEATPTRHEHDGHVLTFSHEAAIHPPLGESGPVAVVHQGEHDNAAAIVALRNAAPSLLAELRALRAAAAAARAYVVACEAQVVAGRAARATLRGDPPRREGPEWDAWRASAAGREATWAPLRDALAALPPAGGDGRG